MRRAQTSTMDLVIALSLLVVVGVLVASYGFDLNQPPETISDAQALAQAVYNPYPTDYNQTSVVLPGFVVNHRLNQSLFARFQALSNVQRLVGMTSNYYINTTLGTAGTPPSNATDIYSVTRYAAYNGTITPIEVIAWTE